MSRLSHKNQKRILTEEINIINWILQKVINLLIDIGILIMIQRTSLNNCLIRYFYKHKHSKRLLIHKRQYKMLFLLIIKTSYSQKLQHSKIPKEKLWPQFIIIQQITSIKGIPHLKIKRLKAQRFNPSRWFLIVKIIT